MLANMPLLASLALFSAFTLSLASSHASNHHRVSHNKRRIDTSLTSDVSTTLQQRALPADWTYLGCYAEPSGGRALATRANFPDGASMTQDICAAYCHQNNFQFAGVEYMWECWCGNTLNTQSKLPESECAMTCTGDSSQRCGGPFKINVLKKGPATTTPDPTPVTFTELGCYTDQTPRTLTGHKFDAQGSMTRELCAATCAQAGFAYAGVEYMWECHCGNTISPSATKLSNSDCSMNCAGNSGQKCGAGWRINILTISGGTTPDPDPEPASDYALVGCFTDDWSRTLTTVGNVDTSGQTVEKCLNICRGKSLPFAGVETGSECWCGSKISQGRTKLASDATCNMPCTGNQAQKCGGSWRLNVYHNPAFDSDDPTPDQPPTSGDGSLASDWWTASGAQNGGKLIVAHFMMGNCYSYTLDTWKHEINIAKAQGLDAFALNMGNDAFIRGQVANAYQAAQEVGFKMFFSMDVTAMGCSSGGHADNIRGYLSQYNNHPAQLKDRDGRAIVSTFSGEYCYFGRGSVNEGWQYAVKDGFNTNFIPSFFGEPSGFDGLIPARNGDFNWNGGWPDGNHDTNWDLDDRHLRYNSGRTYMTSVSPAFFTHYGAWSWNKNWIWRSDNHLYATRWEHLVAHRGSVDIVQVVTWNDYGESSYIGPIGVDQPNSQAWTNGYDHTAYLAITGYYAAAYKTGNYPIIVKDKIFMCSRPHPKAANAQNDPIGKPTYWEWTDDNVYVILFSTGGGTLIVSAGGNEQSFTVTAGVNKVAIPSGPNMSAKLVRNGVQLFNFAPSGFTYSYNPQTYNYNYFAAHGP